MWAASGPNSKSVCYFALFADAINGIPVFLVALVENLVQKVGQEDDGFDFRGRTVCADFSGVGLQASLVGRD